MTKTKPAHEIRLGRIRATIWENDTESGVRYNVTFSRLYKSEDGWKDSTSMGLNDLLLVAKVADLAHSWIFEQNGERNQEEGEPEQVEEPAPRRAASSSLFV